MSSSGCERRESDRHQTPAPAGRHKTGDQGVLSSAARFEVALQLAARIVRDSIAWRLVFITNIVCVVVSLSVTILKSRKIIPPGTVFSLTWPLVTLHFLAFLALIWTGISAARRAKRIAAELAPICPKCAYSLRGLTSPTTCPECGSKV